MAERIPPGFTIPIAFYDGPEVKSIPKRVRAAAIGVWALAGNYSSTRLSDGYVDDETLRDFGCGPAIREALMNTRGPAGKPNPLWLESDGGIVIANWEKWQRTAAEVKTYRESEAERKRAARAAKKANRSATTNGSLPDHYPTTTELLSDHSSTVIDVESSGPAETAKRPADVRPESGQSESETRDRDLISGSVEHASLRNVDEQRGQERGRSNPVDVSASRLVATLIPSNIPAAVKTSLRLAASQLIVGDGLPSEVVAEALRRWASKSGSGPGLLPHIAADVVREKHAMSAPNARPNGLTAGEAKVLGWAELGSPEPTRKAIEG